ncbi:bifunctional diguanylate cyclase/phosphodiesterase [Vibrio coralliirubri]|uniref:putative bifunctional diguanylate cyclase/phosphodiesterase n=1 Tax=Vibrio coralliirubri TaxID=1516159 RepID=UPI002285223D|nr:bifunctional diguanylate cyclase/phosphodiesterase [Vibrio coralliirubri]MCY9860924.1 bifunctional diguanylate cyclase/phosphodiesterase [Vibrio coralliirubri]
MRHSHEILRIGLASASLGTLHYPVLSGVITGTLLLSYLLPIKVSHSIETDPVTGLLVLDSFKKNLNELILRESTNDSQRRIYVASIDILGFGDINKQHGYTNGRLALQAVARSIKQDSKTVFASRPFGDVFLLAYISESHDQIIMDLDSIITNAESLCSTLPFSMVLSAGVTEIQLASEDGTEIDLISSAINQAEVARLIGKRLSLKINNYKSEYANKHLEKIRMEDSLLKSIENCEISVFYQPKFTCELVPKIAGFEALCRWYHKELGFISPAFFIPLSEDTGFIHQLGAHVLDESCKTISELDPTGEKNLTIAVNVSISQLEYLSGKPLISKIRDLLKQYNLKPSCLEVEITESMAAKDFTLIKQHVRTLREMGVTVSLDDFGTGESTLYRLKELPLHQLKIDKAFVDDLNTDSGKEVMKGIFKIADAMGLTTVAEGVETNEQALALKMMGCTYLQGYLLGKPMPKDSIIEMIK